MVEHDTLAPWPDSVQVLETEYRLVTVDLTIADRRLELLKVANIDDLLDRVDDPDEIPFWADLWPSSIGLARYLLQHRNLIAGKTLLELGAGVGLAGIAAKLAGARVVQSDFSPEALKFTAANCIRNRVAVGAQLLADWRQFPAEAGPFDLIIGADILYEKTLHGALRQIFLERLQPDGAVWLADPGRDYARKFMEEWPEPQGVSKALIPVEYERKQFSIDLYRLSR